MTGWPDTQMEKREGIIFPAVLEQGIRFYPTQIKTFFATSNLYFI